MKVLVVGAGFLGRPLAARLAKAGHRLRILDHNPPVAGLDWVQAELGDEPAMARATDGMEAVVHLASTTVPATSNSRPQEDVRVNLVGSLVLMEAAAKAGARRFVFASSGGTVYGITPRRPIAEAAPTEPISSYGAVKLAIEKYLGIFERERGLDPRILRLANVYGPGQRLAKPQGAVGWFVSKALARQPVTIWGDGTAVRDYVYVDDAVAALAAAVTHEGPGRLFNVGSGQGTDLLQLLARIERHVGHPVPRELLPARGFDVPYNVLDRTRAGRELGWEPAIPLDEGLARTVAWMREAHP